MARAAQAAILAPVPSIGRYLLFALTDAPQLVGATATVPALHLDPFVDGFRHCKGSNGHGRDHTGYEDGTEYPEGDAALQAALVQDGDPSLHGSSLVAVQPWVHVFTACEAMDSTAQDHVIGRWRSGKEEVDDAPEYSDVKRTAHESFTPEAFVLRRSMPRAAGVQTGLDDGLVDELFQMSRTVTGACFRCPPLRDAPLDLQAVGL